MGNPETGAWSEDRIGDVVHMMVAQDSTTWTIMSISLGGQLLLLGFYFQSAPNSLGRLLIPPMGLVTAIAFALFVGRSNSYMRRHARTLHAALPDRQEFHPLIGMSALLTVRLTDWVNNTAPAMVERWNAWVSKSALRRKVFETGPGVLQRLDSATSVLWLVNSIWIFLWMFFSLLGWLLGPIP